MGVMTDGERLDRLQDLLRKRNHLRVEAYFLERLLRRLESKQKNNRIALRAVEVVIAQECCGEQSLKGS